MSGELTTGYWFKSSVFEVDPGEDSETNPRRYGRQPATWLHQEFKKLGYDVEDVIAEDWGWYVMCQREPYSLWIGCGSMEDLARVRAEDPPPSREQLVWHVFPVAEVPLFKYLFRQKPDTSSGLAKLDNELKTILRNHDEIRILDEAEVEELLDPFGQDEEAAQSTAVVDDQHAFSRGARWLLAFFSFLFAFVMYLHGKGHPSPLFSYFFSFFCAAIGLVCITSGRVRQFFGSFVGVTLFAAGIWYLFTEVTGGPVLSESRSEPSVVNALFFLAVFGVPGLLYAFSAKFGIRKTEAK